MGRGRCMRLTRRSFIKLAPISVAIGLASWWLLEKENPVHSSNPVEGVGSTQSTLAVGGILDFPVAWNGGRSVHIDPNDYRLTLDGDVSNPLKLTLKDLQGMPSVDERSTIECMEGWDATVTWEGVPLSYLLLVSGAPSRFDHVTVKSIDGYATEISQNDVADLGILIALKAESAPLRAEHGYPARLVFPTKPGYQWVKYVNRITCTRT
jgi:DMSO/TMAO reductase YedYZ molybdopterin-dependent catalytic subunit